MPARSRTFRTDDDGASRTLGTAVAVVAALGLVSTVFVLAFPPQGTATASELGTFKSRADLAEFLEEREASTHGIYGSGVAMEPVAAVADSAESGSGGASRHSTTNVQVPGVDEADIVKSDGHYIYMVSEGRVVVVHAFPPSAARVVGEVPLPDGQARTLFLSGDRLVVIGGPKEPARILEGDVVDPDGIDRSLPEQPVLPKTYVRVYDVSDPGEPSLKQNVTVDGRYREARLQGGHAYVVLDVPLRFDDQDRPHIPTFHPDQDGFPKIRYVDGGNVGYRYTNVVSVAVQGDAPVRNEAFLIGRTTDLYASTSHLYLATPITASDGDRLRLLGADRRTQIHKIQMDDGRVRHVAQGQVPGRVLNQFSMDEHDGHLRVATTVGHVSRGTDGERSSSNNVYVLGPDMQTVGRIEGIAPGEKIYSARFLGERAYLVTFKKVDPFFVLDLAEPTDPEVLGELKLPGYSDYLHPIGDDRVIGVGKQTVAAESGDFAWYQGVKVAVFDASDVDDPKVLDTMVIGDRGTESAVLRDHKAFLYDSDRRFMVLPILEAEVDTSKYPDGDPPPNAHGEPVWQGAYVLDVDADGELSRRGRVTHIEGEIDPWHARSDFVRRSITMDDVLYTVSESEIQAHALDGLSELARVEVAPS